MDAALGRDVNSQLLPVAAGVNVAVTAGGSGDATLVTGDSISLLGLSERPKSVMFVIPVNATVADGEDIAITGQLETSDDGGTTWTAVAAVATLLTLSVSGGGSTKGVARLGADLAKQDLTHVRVKYTPDMSAADTDTAAIGAPVAVFGGLDKTPSTVALT